MKQVTIGSFEVVSARAIVSDPCYETGTWCQGVLENVLNGKWNAHIWSSHDRVAEVVACHGAGQGSGTRWDEEPFEVGVDSGQAGIFDAAHYRDDSVVLTVKRIYHEVICADEPWYSICCDRTLGNESGAGIIPFGVVSSSGYGDGGYRCYTRKNAEGCIVAIRIIFIQEDEE